MSSSIKSNSSRTSRVAASLLFIAAGLNHFRNPVFYKSIIPPSFPRPDLLVTISGLAEIAGGVGLLIKPLRKIAGVGLIALLLAVFPANVFMANHPDRAGVDHWPRWILWARLPLQAVLIAWVVAVSLRTPRDLSDGEPRDLHRRYRV